jgi:hypothetical protein
MYDPFKYDGKRYQDPQFAYPVFYRSFNKSYYHLSVWNGIRQSGWLGIANKVPQLKQVIMKNQMTIKYRVVKEILSIKPGKRVDPCFSVQNNVLTTGAKIASSSIYFAWKETHIRESRIESKTIEKPVYKVTGFQNFLIWSGGIAWVIIVILVAIKLIRFYLKRKLLP